MPHQFKSPPSATGGWLSTRGDGDQRDHRGMVLREVCNLEFHCAQLLFACFCSKNPALTWDQANRDLFEEAGLLGSLSRMVKLCWYLGLISEDLAFDLRRLARLRNMYAHGKDRGQFLDDADAVAVLRSLRLVQNSAQLIGGVTDEGLLLACTKFFAEQLSLAKAKFTSMG